VSPAASQTAQQNAEVNPGTDAKLLQFSNPRHFFKYDHQNHCPGNRAIKDPSSENQSKAVYKPDQHQPTHHFHARSFTLQKPLCDERSCAIFRNPFHILHIS
jgi:hypothetical protein